MNRAAAELVEAKAVAKTRLCLRQAQAAATYVIINYSYDLFWFFTHFLDDSDSHPVGGGMVG
jgi:hypothetical protein